MIKRTAARLPYYGCTTLLLLVWLTGSVVYGQTETRPLFDILKELHQKRGAYFLFAHQSFGEKQVKPCPFGELPVEKILECLLAESGLHFKQVTATTFVIIESTAKPSSIGPVTSFSELVMPIKGIVLSTQGAPVPNASVELKHEGKWTGVTTDGEGRFVLTAPKPEFIQVSSIGFLSQKITHIQEGDQLRILLEPEQREMAEVVVTSLGVQREKKSLGYALSTIQSDEINRVANTNFATALYGKAAGVRIATAPGGATSAVQVQIRGLNSLNFNAQPLYILDGAVIRNINEKGTAGINNNGYWEDQRIRGNGILDINPLDIESITILKGASATALYGSEAANGVVVITSKKGTRKKGMGIEFNYAVNAEKAAFLPKFQNEFGPGLDRISNLAAGATEEGWIPVDADGDGNANELRPNFLSWAQFGPRMEGQVVPWWDGSYQSYSPQPDNYRALFRTGMNSLVNIAFADQTEKAAYRMALTRNDYKGIQVGGQLQRTTFFLNTQYKISPKLAAEVVFSWVNSKVDNRPLQLARIVSAYNGFISRAEKTALLFDRYKTTEGYKWVPSDQWQRNPAEALAFPFKEEALNLLWTQLRNKEEENQNRLFSVATLRYNFNEQLYFRARVGQDFTSLQTETTNFNEYPEAFNTMGSTGAYGNSNGRYSLLYGDFLATYDAKIGESVKLSFNGGYQAREEKYTDQLSMTTGGLVKENWFNLANSYGPVSNSTQRINSLHYAWLGFAQASYKNLYFLELTARKEYSSTLPPGNNSYFYPSVNGSILLNETFDLPSFINTAKLRASYGRVGNSPPPYTAAITYSQQVIPTQNGNVSTQQSQTRYGNNQIRPEQKEELELGLETVTLNNRLGINFTWYSNLTRNQILQLTIPSSMGASSRLVNSGTLFSKGIELGLDAIPVLKRNYHWKTSFNLSYVSTKTRSLAPGVKEMVYLQMEQGAIRIMAEEGKKVGNIYVYPKKTNEQGQPVIGENGLYLIDNTRYKKVGNVMPDFIGGWLNSFRFKQFSLDCMMDYRIGGQLVSPSLKYNTGAGMYTSTLAYRNEKYGGLPYYINEAGLKIQLDNHQQPAPGGARVYHDGLILPGVGLDGKPNTKLVDAAYYYMNMFYWGPNALNEEGAVYDNSYLKMREASITYNLPAKILSKWKLQSMRVSLIGRNLFYIWRTLENLDPETPIGTAWTRQSIDDGTTAATRSYGASIQLGF
ncbi:SusC/RagA family TonB-linked outer membrane protein [Flavihumibacter sp. CACIAM 22H1]|uniref:SusC/RagA family TonB-linked outer membrane protein n=1 Tax=Flavihumibacter sp. CACIAM 22H1 TaxID=1812911 RepID=UPI0007A92849|nr:SusC/RagA family TonB-linked outer membrane protein [Flavihumibacter sp. CACIAM 22H1]KYP14764.1 MAG: SusC/RagA family protein [Flavihumibacter sp. CACIAM 22H1]